MEEGDEKRWIALADQMWEELCLHGRFGSKVNIVLFEKDQFDATYWKFDKHDYLPDEVVEKWDEGFWKRMIEEALLPMPQETVLGLCFGRRVRSDTMFSGWCDIGQPVVILFLADHPDLEGVAAGEKCWEVLQSSQIFREYRVGLEVRIQTPDWGARRYLY